MRMQSFFKAHETKLIQLGYTSMRAPYTQSGRIHEYEVSIALVARVREITKGQTLYESLIKKILNICVGSV